MHPVFHLVPKATGNLPIFLPDNPWFPDRYCEDVADLLHQRQSLPPLLPYPLSYKQVPVRVPSMRCPLPHPIPTAGHILPDLKADGYVRWHLPMIKMPYLKSGLWPYAPLRSASRFHQTRLNIHFHQSESLFHLYGIHALQTPYIPSVSVHSWNYRWSGAGLLSGFLLSVRSHQQLPLESGFLLHKGQLPFPRCSAFVHLQLDIRAKIKQRRSLPLLY